MPQPPLPAARARAAKQVVLSACLACAALLVACDRSDTPVAEEADAAADTQAALTVTTAKVESRDLVRAVPATGSIFPWQEVIISPEVGGYRVDAVLVDVGSRVQKGQELVRLSTDMLDADLNSRRAALRSAEASLTNAAAALRRGESISTSGALSAADLDQLRAEHVAAQARVETARADLTTAELRLRYGTVRAPDAGTITVRTVTTGQIAQAGQEMLRMLRQDRVEWRAEIPEAQLSRIKVGQQAEIFAADGSVLKGRVRTVAPTVQTNSRTGLAYVDITSGEAKPGMFARGQIAAGSGSGVLVPISSVVMQDGYSYVFVVKEGNVVERRRIEQAGVYGDQLEVGSGLAPGDVIAVRGAGFLKDGDKVAIATAVPGETAAVAAD
ncbi:MAG TPA: efflux RND transporter periplasmic adaptor subunit [Steroidobacteraceae bacterium]|nr:efflux RND transporter periplasmic adaptor subunit [Steroidobacteraceae bacterium]